MFNVFKFKELFLSIQISPDRIIEIKPYEIKYERTGSIITIDNGREIIVKENPEEIKRKIKENTK
jgi:hypothetical protein